MTAGAFWRCLTASLVGGLALWHPVTASRGTDIIYFSDAGWHQMDPREPLKAIWKRAF